MSSRIKLNVLTILFLFPLLIFGKAAYKTDTLAHKNYKELKTVFYNNLDNPVLAKSIAYYTMRKARKEHFYTGVANSYIRLHYIYEDNIALATKYLDSSITVCKTNGIKDLLAENYYHKGDLNYTAYNYSTALKFFLKSRNIYKDINDASSLNVLNYSIGLLKLQTYSKEDAVDALNIFKTCLDYEKTKFNPQDSIVPYSYIETLRSIAISYIYAGKLDSSSITNKKGYKLALRHPEYNPLEFTLTEGSVQFSKDNYTVAKDSLLKAVPFLKKKENKADLALTYHKLGFIYEEAGDVKKTIPYYKKVDSLYRITKYLSLEPRDLYITLINYYKNNSDIKNQLYYTQQLLKIDSVLTKKYSNINHEFIKNYNVPELQQEKTQLSKQLNNVKNNSIWYKVIGCLLIIVFIFLSFFFYRKKKKTEQKFKRIITELEVTNTVKQNTVKQKKQLSISTSITATVLKELDDFEHTQAYIKPNVTLNSLAKFTHTNTKYLSNVINTQKGKNFNNYINDLRVEYAIKELNANSVFRNYTIKAIANDVGFSNTESFTKAFYKKTGVKVSYFIKNLNN